MKKIVLRPKCKLRIRHVRKIGDGDWGEFLELSNKAFKQFFDIKISIIENKRPTVWFRTLVHELFHFAFHILYLVFGLRVIPRSEHTFIGKMEDTMLLSMSKLRFYKEKGKKVSLDKEES